MSEKKQPAKINLPSDHFDGEKFFYPGIKAEKSFSDFLKWQLNRNSKSWPKFIDDVVQVKPTSPEVGTYKITFVNHVTMLIQIGNLNILTDPVWSERTSPFSFIGPKRMRKPGIALEDLPKIDLVLVSHNHYDHLDIETLVKLEKQHSPQFVVALGDGALLQSRKIKNAVELDWEEFVLIGRVKVTFEKAAHWSGRGLRDRCRSLWGAFMIEYGETRIYFAGDTGYQSHFKELKQKYKDVSVALLPIGAYEPRWFMREAHMNPADAVLAFQDLQPKKAIGIHFGTFKLTDEAWDDPVLDLKIALEKANISAEQFLTPVNGQGFVFKY